MEPDFLCFIVRSPYQDRSAITFHYTSLSSSLMHTFYLFSAKRVEYLPATAGRVKMPFNPSKSTFNGQKLFILRGACYDNQ